MSTKDVPTLCVICEVVPHDTLCDRCSRPVCYGCFDIDLCVECSADLVEELDESVMEDDDD